MREDIGIADAVVQHEVNYYHTSIFVDSASSVGQIVIEVEDVVTIVLSNEMANRLAVELNQRLLKSNPEQL